MRALHAMAGIARAALRGALLAALLGAALGCKKDTGVIGDRAAPLVCEPECAPDERCDSELGTCTPCGDDCEGPADAGPGACNGEQCECSDDDECDEDAPLCVDNRCSPCEEDSDCDGEGERACEEGRCVEVEDDEEQEGSAGDGSDD